MKTLSAFIILSLLSAVVYSQNEAGNSKGRGEINTLFGGHSVSNGGYGSFGCGYSSIDNRDGIVISGRAAWIIDHNFAIGVAGSGFMNDFQYDRVYNEDVNLTGGYGGLLIEPILFPKAPVHLTFPVIGAVGGIASTRTSHTFNSWDNSNSWVEASETFLLVEPGVELELNLVRFFRLAFGISYRFTTDLELLSVPPDALEGFTTGITFKFGKF